MELRLIYEDENGKEEVDVTASRFTIGRHADNDFVIDDSNLSRRHAVIENFDGVYFLSDCGSQNGTTLNGRSVSGPVEIHDGDVILLGDVEELKVKFFDPKAEQKQTRPKSVSIKNSPLSDSPTVSHKAPPQPEPVGLSTQTIQIIIAVMAVSVLLIIGTVAIIGIGISGKNGKDNNSQVVNNGSSTNNSGDTNNSGNNTEPPPSPDASPSGGTQSPDPTPPQPNKDLDNLEKAAIQFLLKFNTNDKRKYAFDEKDLSAIKDAAERYRSSSQTGDAIKNLQRNIQDLSAIATQNNIQPGLLIYAALAKTDGGRNGDPVAVAKQIASDLGFLETTFGEEDVDSYLLVIAAYPEGRGEKKYHPMDERLRRNKGKRNVWDLNKNGGVKPAGYELVLKTIALGAISQNPQLFGINVPPLTF